MTLSLQDNAGVACCRAHLAYFCFHTGSWCDSVAL